jgi:hypothetical protein
MQGFNSVERDTVKLDKLWCQNKDSWVKALGFSVANTSHQCTEMSLQVIEWGSACCHYSAILYSAVSYCTV